MTPNADMKKQVLDSLGLAIEDLPLGMKKKWQALTDEQKTSLLDALNPRPALEDRLVLAKLALLTAANGIGIDLGSGN